MHKRALCITLYLFYCAVFCENEKFIKKPLTVLAYLKSIKNGQTLKIPAFLISPIIIVPKENKEHDANGQAMNSEDNFEDKSAIFKKIIPVKIILNDTGTDKENNDIEVSFRQALNRGSGKSDEKENKTSDTVPPDNMAGTTDTNTTTQINKTTTSTATTTAAPNVTIELASTEANSLKPAVNNPQAVNTITITDGPTSSFLLPPLIDEEWKNFTVTADINITKPNNTESFENSNNSTLSPSVNVTDSTIKGPYPAALYHNVEIDQVSITTNSYTNESPLPPRQDDRWRSFSSLGEMFSTSSEFRPLAGLYYDGFLHRPLPNRNPGFVPYNRYFLY